MTFAAPLWLIALLPWAGVSALLLRRRGRPQAVPFLALWTAQRMARRSAGRAPDRPPVWAACLIASMGTALLAAARPGWDASAAAATASRGLVIVSAGARSAPMPQVMVGLRNDSAATRGTIRLSSGAGSMQQPIELPPLGGQRNYFLNPQALGSTIDIEASNSAEGLAKPTAARLMRQPTWPRLATIGDAALPAPLQRLVRVYRDDRPGSGDGPIAVISAGPLSADAIGATILLPETNQTSVAALAAPTVVPHPLVVNVVSWPAAARKIDAPAGWDIVARREGTALLAVRRSDDRRQVWVNLDLSDWSNSADFVVFFTNVFDWLGQAGANAGADYALQSAGTTAATAAAASSSQAGLGRQPPVSRPLSGLLCLTAAGFALMAAVAWPGNRLQK